ncbi:unnamed protein product [Tenebrio molitor]|nr:unnamed protein product [Tenebrio molitor]
MSAQICCKCMGNVITLSECSCGVQRVLQSDFRKDTILGQVQGTPQLRKHPECLA